MQQDQAPTDLSETRSYRESTGRKGLGLMAANVPESLGKDMYVPKNIQHNAGVLNFMCALAACLACIQAIMSLTAWVHSCRTHSCEGSKCPAPKAVYMLCTCSGVFGALVAGLIAGLWGVTGWGGFMYYVAMHCVVRACPPLLHPWLGCGLWAAVLIGCWQGAWTAV